MSGSPWCRVRNYLSVAVVSSNSMPGNLGSPQYGLCRGSINSGEAITEVFHPGPATERLSLGSNLTPQHQIVTTNITCSIL
jgi:hypothetical protein